MTPAVSRRTSVIIAARDAEHTLGETLDSLLAQTDPDWEALVVDDGSTDATADIIAAYAARDDRIAALASTGLGASTARNLALARAEGDRLLFLDSDDWIDRTIPRPDECGTRREQGRRRRLLRLSPRDAERPADARL